MLQIVLIVIALLLFSSNGYSSPIPIDLQAIQHVDAELVVVDAQGNEITYSQAALEELPTYRLKTTTPWREQSVQFDGVLLRDLLAQHGLNNVDAIMVSADDDYTAVIPKQAWQSENLMIATRVNGKAHTRRMRGPFQIVIDAAAYRASNAVAEVHLIWMLNRIELNR